MSTVKSKNRQSPASKFLSGSGPNPVPKTKQHKVGSRARKFIQDAMQEIGDQDRENTPTRSATVADDLSTIIR